MEPDVEVGNALTLQRTFTQQDFDRFARISGDNNPIHVDPEFSARTRFGKTVCHGMMLYATINKALSTHFPGARQLEQELMFPTPTFVGEEVTVQLEVLEVWDTAHLARIKTIITKASGETACEGQTLVQWK
jgi:3-hydroxybutyryl-CoA dehydratase